MLTKIMRAILVAAALVALGGGASAQFAGQATWAGTSAGAANAQTITLPNVGTLADLRGVTISWIVGAGLTNTGPATVTINSLTPVNVMRMNGGALISLGGAEMPAGNMVQGTYDGTEIILLTNYTGTDPVGTSKIANYGTADPGYLLEYGQCVAQATYPALYAKLSTTYNTADGCTGSNFGLPDKRGRMPAGQDNMGGVAAGRITLFTATAIGNSGGIQSSVVQQANLANFGLPTSFSLTTHVPTYQTLPTVQGGSGAGNIWSGPGAADIAATGTITVTSGGGSTPLATLSPTQIVVYEIKY